MSAEYSRIRPVVGFIIMGLVTSCQLSAQAGHSEVRAQRIVGLEYPWFGRIVVVQGNVELAATVSRDGSVKRVRVISGAPPLAVPAKEALAQWLFIGCTSLDGCEIQVTFTFVLSGSCDASSHCPSEFQVDLPNQVTVKAKAFKAIVN